MHLVYPRAGHAGWQARTDHGLCGRGLPKVGAADITHEDFVNHREGDIAPLKGSCIQRGSIDDGSIQLGDHHAQWSMDQIIT